MLIRAALRRPKVLLLTIVARFTGVELRGTLRVQISETPSAQMNRIK
ncbi:MAG: hypothetical protein IJS90_10670 [Clostridia bacterium]|nr:hypothetical protein [Clostridia bacterium]